MHIETYSVVFGGSTIAKVDIADMVIVPKEKSCGEAVSILWWTLRR